MKASQCGFDTDFFVLVSKTSLAKDKKLLLSK